MLRGAAAAMGVGALAGCVTGGRLNRYRIRNDPVPDALPATVSAEAVATPSQERPLLLEIEFASTASEPTEFAVEPPGPFPLGRTTAKGRAPSTRSPATGTETRQVVLDTPGTGTFVEGCWTATDPGGSSDGTTGSDRVRLDPGESITVERVVLNHPSNGICYPIADYRFSAAFRSVAVSAQERGDGPSVPWGFSLEITDLRQVE